MKTQSTILAIAALSLACIASSSAADPAVPDFLKEVVIKAAPPLTKEQRAGARRLSIEQFHVQYLR